MFFCFYLQNRKCEQIYQVDDDDILYRVVTPSVQHGCIASSTSTSQAGGNLQDFILLASKRKPCDSGSVSAVSPRTSLCHMEAAPLGKKL